MSDLVERLGLGGSGAALRDDQRPDCFDVAVTRFCSAGRSAGLCGTRRLDGIQRVGLALTAAHLPIRAIYLHDINT